MRLWITLKSYSNRSLIKKCFAAVSLVWITLQIPILIFSYTTSLERQSEDILNQQRASEKVYLTLIESVSRFGDLVSARGQALQLGEQSGLVAIIICDGPTELLGKFNENRCVTPVESHFGFINFNNKQVQVRFLWDEKRTLVDHNLFVTSLLTSLLALFIILGSSLFTYQLIQRRLKTFSSDLSRVSLDGEVIKREHDMPEMAELIKSVNVMRLKLRESHKLEIDNVSLKIFGDLARQVAHDIRSPLSALEMAMYDLDIGEEKKMLLSQASKRIKSIAEDLLKKSRNMKIPSSSADESPRECMQAGFDVNKIINEIILEKIVANPSVNFEFSSLGSVKAIGDEPDFSRILSNLIDNAIESSDDVRKLSVKINLRIYRKKVAVIIQDNGKGIAADVLPKIGSKGFTLGKPNGNGLGVFMAKDIIFRWGGDFHIASQEGLGTIVTISLPQLSWFQFSQLNQERKSAANLR